MPGPDTSPPQRRTPRAQTPFRRCVGSERRVWGRVAGCAEEVRRLDARAGARLSLRRVRSVREGGVQQRELRRRAVCVRPAHLHPAASKPESLRPARSSLRAMSAG
eukprot:2439297-Rhodomonas_salina.1